MTRRRKAQIIEQSKGMRFSSPDKTPIDLSKCSHCPLCKQSLMKLNSKEPETPMKTPNTRRRTAAMRNGQNGMANAKRVKEDESEDSEFSLEKKLKKAKEDPNQNKRRKSKAQVKMLENELEANPHWTNEDMVKIAKKTGLTKSQVYKWNWDQKKKLNILPSKVYVVQLPNDMLDTKSGQIVLKGADGLKKLQTLNLESIVKNANKK